MPAAKHKVPPAFVKSIMAAESNFYPSVISNKGAIGLMQLMPETAEQFGVNPNDPAQNVDGGAKYLSVLMARYKKSRNWMTRVIAAYNAGPGVVDRYRGCLRTGKRGPTWYGCWGTSRDFKKRARTGLEPYSKRSGSRRLIIFHMGWNWNQPLKPPATCWRVTRAFSWEMWTGLPAASARSWAWQLRSHGDKPPGGFVHRGAYGEQAVVAEDERFAGAQRLCDAIPFRSFVDHPGVIVEERVVLVKCAGILRDGVEQAAERRPGFAVHGVRMGGGHGIGARGMDSRVDGKGGGIHVMAAFDDFAGVIHQDQV